MKQVVIVAPYFPPSNLAGVHRARLFALHLPKFGWKVKILSVDPAYYEEELDSELAALTPPNLEIIRTPAFPIRPLRLIGDLGIRSFWWHFWKLRELIKREQIDLIYIPIQPNYSALLGPLIHLCYGIPYAIDYMDPWINIWPGCEKVLSKAWLAYQLNWLLEPIALRKVSLVTAVASGYYEGVKKRYRWLESVPFVSMPMGAEEGDYTYLDKNPRQPYLFDPADGKFHITYAGAMLPRAFSTLAALFQSIISLRQTQPSIAQKLRFHFIGTGSVSTDKYSFMIKPIAMQFDLQDIVSEHPARIPYLDVLNHLKYSNAVLILGSSESHYTPSKVYQAVLSRRPILALLHSDSTAVKVLTDTQAGIVVKFNDQITVHHCIGEIVEAIEILVNTPYAGEKIKWNAFSAYSAETATQQVAQAFKGIF